MEPGMLNSLLPILLHRLRPLRVAGCGEEQARVSTLDLVYVARKRLKTTKNLKHVLRFLHWI